MNKKRKYVVPMAIAVAVESIVILAASGGEDSYKVTGKSNSSEPQLEYGGEGGGSLYDPD